MAGPVGYEQDDDGFGRTTPFASEQLVLTDPDDDRLPWLEASDYDEPERGLDFGRLAGFGLLLLIVLAAAAGIWWYLSKAKVSGDLQPVGTTIAAPQGPYKVRPSEEGGKVFEGTGDTSFAVGEGQRREGRIARTQPKPAPAASPAVGASPSPSSEPEKSPETAPPAAGPAVQVGAYASRSDAERGWQTLMRQTEKLNGVSHRIVEGQADIGTVFRLQAVAGSLESARALCAGLKQDGVACQVKR